MPGCRTAALVIFGFLLARTNALNGVPCNGTGTPCVIQLGGLFARGCGDLNYIASSIAMVRLVNALDNGKGFGVYAGNSAYTHFFKFNFSHATYTRGEFDTVGASAASTLFPRLHFIVGQGAQCGAEDKNSLQMAKIADDASRIFITQRGPSGFMMSEPRKKHMFSTHLNSDLYPVPAIRR